MPSMSSLPTAFAVMLMMHAAYSCLHYRSILQNLDLEDSFAIPPMDVYIEVGIAYVILLVAELTGAGKMQQVEVAVKSRGQKRRQLQAPAYLTRDFDIYANRSKFL